MAKKPQEPNNYEAPVPEQVRKQMEEADAIRAQMVQGEGSPSSDTSGDPPPAAPEAPAPPSAGQPPAPEPEESWEQRYKSLHGRFEQQAQTTRQLHERLAHLDNLIATMQAKGADPAAATAPPAAPTYSKATTSQDVNDYGEDLLNVIGRRSRDEYAPEFDKLAQRLNKLEGRVEGVGTVLERDQKTSVYQGLDQHVEGWRDINKHPVFKQWLQQLDPFSGRPRQEMLTEAFSRHETGRVVAFFRGFLSEAAGPPPEGTSPGSSAPHQPNGNGSGKPSLEDFAAPGRARSAPQDLPPDKPVYTTAEITKFFADKRVGKWRGREAEAEAIERDIFQAQHEGRIQ